LIRYESIRYFAIVCVPSGGVRIMSSSFEPKVIVKEIKDEGNTEFKPTFALLARQWRQVNGFIPMPQ
jgi:hypothetical protein